jgi:hypothetical protein
MIDINVNSGLNDNGFNNTNLNDSFEEKEMNNMTNLCLNGYINL